MSFTSSDRETVQDQIVLNDLVDSSMTNKLLIRLVAKRRSFKGIDFKYSIFDTCYFRNCSFDSCNFTGCRFVGTNFSGSSFVGCIFDYSYFEKTFIDSSVLDNCCPGWENLKLKFARSLRINFQQIGDADAVNKAIRTELEATELHLYKSWKSNESYYRKKYNGLDRAKAWSKWFLFKTLDRVWGNGEKLANLFIAVFYILATMMAIDLYVQKNITNMAAYPQTITRIIECFLGISRPTDYNGLYVSFITVLRLVFFGFFLSIIIKRFNRR